MDTTSIIRFRNCDTFLCIFNYKIDDTFLCIFNYKIDAEIAN